MDIAAIPICVAGVLLIAKPSFLFGQHTDRHLSHVGIIVGVGQVLQALVFKPLPHDAADHGKEGSSETWAGGTPQSLALQLGLPVLERELPSTSAAIGMRTSH